MSITTAQVTSTLENVLFESPTLAAANAKTVNLSSYTSVDAYAQALTSSAEFSIVERVVSYYQDALGRTPGGVEIAYYVNLAEQGSTAAGIAAATSAQIAAGATGISNATWDQIATFFAASGEFQVDYGVQANSVTAAGYDNLITSLYHNVLGRTASSAEIAYYVAALTAGASPATLMQWFSESPEFQAAANPQIVSAITAYNDALLAGGSSTTAITSHIGPASYTLSHDSQTSITEGSTDTFSVSTQGVASGTTLYYTLSGVTSSEVAGGALSGSVIIDSHGDATLAVTLSAGAGQGLSGDLTATLSTTSGGAAVATSSVALTETANQAFAIVALPTLGGTGTVVQAVSSTGDVVGLSSINDGQAGPFSQIVQGTQHAFVWDSSTGTMTDLGTLPGLTAASEAVAINSSNEVIGWSVTGNPGTQGTAGGAFLWSDGQMVNIGALTANGTSQPRGINDLGQVVGQSNADAFVWTPSTANGLTGTMVDLGKLPGDQGGSLAAAINNVGEVAGVSISTTGGWRAFLWTPTSPNGSTGRMVDLGTVNADINPFARGINASGEVVGTATNASGATDAWIWVPAVANGATGTMTLLPTLGGVGEFASAINAAGLIVGQSGTTGNISHATLWEGGKAIDLNSLLPAGSGWVLENATAINDAGQVVGTASYKGVETAFELTLPSTLLVGVSHTAAHIV